MNDDSQGQFLKVRQDAENDPYKQMLIRTGQVQAAPIKPKLAFETLPVVDFASSVLDVTGDIVADVAGGIIEAPRQIVGGILEASKEAAQALEGLFPLGTVGGGEVGEDSFLSADEARTTTGGLVRGVSQFLTGFLPAVKGMKAVGLTNKLGQAMAGGAAADAIVFDPHEDRLSNLVEEFPILSNPVTGFLSAKPDDTEALGRFKNAVEGLGLGALTDGFIAVAKGIKASRIARLADDAAKAEKVQIDRLADVADDNGVDVGEIKVDDLPFKAETGEARVDELNPTVVMMTPDEYLKEAHEVVGMGADFDDWLGSNRHGADIQQEYADAMSAGDKFPIPYIDKAHGSQDGRNRAIAAKIAGVEKIPVAVVPEKPLAAQLADIENDLLGVEGGYRKHKLEEAANRIREKIKSQTDPEAPKQLPIRDESVEGDFIPFQEKIAAKDAPDFQSGSTKAGEERAANINLNRINSTDEVDGLIEAVAIRDADPINEARREVITQVETEKLANDLGMSVSDLLERRKGQAFNAEQAVAARKILVASGENLVRLAKAAKTGGDVDAAAFRRALAQHTAIQKQVSGLTAEAGRALQSFNIMAKSAKQQERMIREALDAGGGIDISRKMAAMVDSATDANSLNTMTEKLSKAKNVDMVYEAWINGLLSALGTHAVNLLSNSLVAGWTVGERKIASMIGGALDVPSIPKGEASAQAFGLVKGARDGFKLAWEALKTGEPSDVLTKIESAEHKAITAENLGLSGTAGRFADFMGETIRMPGRFLGAEDEFFKSVGYRMELNAQAFRQATNEGLEGQAFAARVQDIIRNPPENIELEAITAMRYQTFTNELGDVGKSVQGTIGKIDNWTKEDFGIPSARVIVPFIRTPTNVMKFALERTPLAPLTDGVKADIAAGGARRDLALAKIATGSMMMAVAADFALSGDITGSGGSDYALKNIKRATGWQPYSIKVGDEYISYSRLDPVGTWLGLAADAVEVMGQVDDADALDIATATAIALSKNLTNKTYMSGVAQTIDVLSSTSAEVDGESKKAKRYIERMLGSFVPAGVAQLERTISPEMSATEGIIEKFRSRIPGLSNDLPPRRNIFGEPVVLEGGIGPDIMSPLYTSTYKADKVAEEIVRQQTRITMPRNVINGVKLDTRQYDQYIRFYAGENNKHIAKPLKTALRDTFNSALYKNASNGAEGVKSVIIRAVFQQYQEAAKEAMIKGDSNLMGDIQATRLEQQIKLGVK